jgi:drug/metabolite transporter (DMT)-like permease
MLAFWRNVFASVALIPLIRRPQWDWRLAPMSIGFTLMSITFLTSMVYTTAANAIWLQNTAPLWILCSGLWIYHEPFDRRNLVPLVTGLLGAALIISCELYHQPKPTSAQGVLLGAASGLFYAIVVVSMRRLRHMNSAWLIAVNHVVAVILLAPWVLTSTPLPTGIQWWVLMAFGFVQMGIPYMLFAEGLKRIPSQEGAAIGLLEPVLVPIWVFLAWGEITSSWTIAGGAIILLGLGWRYLRLE